MPNYSFRISVPITTDDTVIAVFAENAAALQGSDSVTVSPAATPIIQDAFTDTNGTNLSSHTPDVDTVGTGWAVATAGSIQIQSNRAQLGGTTPGQHQYVIDAGEADVTLSATIRAVDASDGAPGLLVRFANNSNKVNVRYNTATDALELYEFISGSASLRDSAAVGAIPAGDPFALTITTSGASITATLTHGGNDYVVSYGSLSNTTATKVGLRDINTGQLNTWDDFEVYAV